MEFKVVQKELELKSRGWIPTFHDVSKEVMEIVAESGVKNGTVQESRLRQNVKYMYRVVKMA